MSFMDFFRRQNAPEGAAMAVPLPKVEELVADTATAAQMPEGGRVQAQVPNGTQFSGLDDPALLEFIRSGASGGSYVSAMSALRNMAVLRSVTLISESIGMLPFNLMEKGPDKKIATTHPVHRLLKTRPNGWQTPYEFKSGLQLNALIHGNAYARVVWSRDRPIALVPLATDRVDPKLSDLWEMQYHYTRPDGGQITLPAREVLHLRDISLDGVKGISRVKLAHQAIALANDAEKAAARIFSSGVMAGGAIEVQRELSDKAYARMRGSLDTDHAGAQNAGRWMLLEDGAKANKWSSTADEAQHIENRNHQIEEVARAFGIPRPLLMMNDTAWGSGIEQLAIFFVQYALQHWFTAWEQAVGRVLLSDAEQDTLHAKFNEHALLRGTLKDQADFFAKASGAGGHAPWMAQNEVRERMDMPRSEDPQADVLRGPSSAAKPTEKEEK